MDKNYILALGTMLAALIASIVAYRKFKPENDLIVVKAAEGLVVLQDGYIERQEARMAAMEERLTSQLQVALDAQRTAEAALAACIAERREVAALYDAEIERNRRSELALRDRVEALETEVAKLRSRAQASRPDDENLS